MATPPTGTVTFLFTDIEGSTRRWEQHREAMQLALARHDTLLRESIEANGGSVFKTVGDAFCAAFPTPDSALQAALQAQRALQAEDWNSRLATHDSQLRVRMALHTGVTEERGGDYFGPPVNRVARLLSSGHGGQTLMTLATQEIVRDHLPVDVNLYDLGEHRLKDLTRPEHIFQAITGDLPSEFPQLKTLDIHPHNLPVQLTPLIGRENELEAINRLLSREDVRLVTLTGTGGTGKTRLGLQVGAELIDEFKDGVFFTNLAPINDPALVPGEVAQTLGVREVAGRTLAESLKEYLRDKRMLLLLDNFEQVAQAAPLVTELLTAAPGLKVLVTSRTVLYVYGEHDFLVPPLQLPDLKRLPPLERLAQYEAVRLFIERAQAAKADFQVTNENAPAVAEICYRLDGLPLAIELAAARVRLLPPHAMLARLQSRLKLLTGGARDLPARQQTLRGAIEWSYDLLDEGEKQLFRRLAVFVGGRTLEAVEAVCNAEGDLEVDVLDGVGSLVDKSLLRQEEGVGGEPRFVMLETIHEYALENLQESGEAEELRRQHALYFVALAEETKPKLRGPEQQLWFDRLADEQENIRAAFDWAQQEGSGAEGVEVGLQLAGALGWYLYMRGPYSEARQRVEGVLARADALQLPKHTAGRARALGTAGLLANIVGDYASARSYNEESLALARQIGDRPVEAIMLNNLAIIATDAEGDLASGRSLYGQSLAVSRELGLKHSVALTLNNLGGIDLAEGDYASARARFEEAIAIAREMQDKRGIASSLQSLGSLAYREGDYPTARSLHEQALAARRELGHKPNIHWSLAALGYTALRQGEYDRAAALFREGLSFELEVGSKQNLEMFITGLAALAAAQGEPERAAKLFGASEAMREAVGVKVKPDVKAEADRDAAAARAQLDEETWQKAWQEGRAMSMEQAIEHALEETVNE